MINGVYYNINYIREQYASFNINTSMKQGCVIAPIGTFQNVSTFPAAFISLAAVDQAKGVGIIYRTDGDVFDRLTEKGLV